MQATVTNVAWYRLGENDPDAASPVAVTNTTTDLAGADHPTQFCKPPGGITHHVATLLPPMLAVNLSPTHTVP